TGDTVFVDGIFFFQAEDGIRDFHVTGVQTCALPISGRACHRTRPHLPPSPPMNAPIPPEQRARNRAMLVLIVVLFLGSALLAGALRLSGWRPEGTRNHGELLEPPVDLRERALLLGDGGRYEWRPAERTWRILVAPRPDCGESCVEL